MKRGFTLVELLVVIAIISLLVAMLLPVMRSLRGTARQVVCGSNMGQLYTGFYLYTQDNRNTLPFVDANNWGGTNVSMRAGEVDWIGYWFKKKQLPHGGTIWPYIQDKSIYLCPEDTGWRGDWHIWTPQPGVHSYSIPVNRECMILDPTLGQKALLVDESQATINDGGFVTTWDSIASRHRVSGYGSKARSRAGGNILLCDGAVEFVQANQVIDANNPMFK